MKDTLFVKSQKYKDKIECKSKIVNINYISPLFLAQPYKKNTILYLILNRYP